MPNFIDLTGKRFGRLVVLHRVENKKIRIRTDSHKIPL